jgi:hypothetical protein
MTDKPKRHKWKKGPLPQTCENCGLIRDRITIKTLMAITNHRPYNHYKYERKMAYKDAAGTHEFAPECKQFYKP